MQKFLFLFFICLECSLLAQEQPIKHDAFKDAMTLYQKKDYLGSITEYDKYISQNPDNQLAYYNRAISKYCLADYKDAMVDFMLCEKKGYSKYEVPYMIGLCYFYSNKYNEALPYLKKSVSLNPSCGKAYVHIAASMYRMNYSNAQEQLDIVNKGIELAPDYKWAYFVRSKIKIVIKDLNGSLADAEIALSFEKRVEYFFNRGYVFLKMGKNELAMIDFDTVISRNPKNADAFYNKGLCEYRIQKYEASINDNKKAIELLPTRSEAYHTMGLCKFELKLYKDAIVDFNSVIGLNPKSFKAFTFRGACHFFFA